MSITPHIVVQGAERAVAFYVDAFGAEEVSRILSAFSTAEAPAECRVGAFAGPMTLPV